MNTQSCLVYEIPTGADRLPFANDKQKLIYETESSELLMRLLEQGLGLKDSNTQKADIQAAPQSDQNTVNVQRWLAFRDQPGNPSATTRRFYLHAPQTHEETAFLLLPRLHQARKLLLSNSRDEAEKIVQRIEQNFPDLCSQWTEYQIFKQVLAENTLNEKSILERLKVLDYEVFNKK
jgi:hypothetical protein